MNAETITLKNIDFYNNNFDFSSVSYQGGFLNIESNSFFASNCTFKKSLGSTGSAVSITSSDSQASYSFVSCKFENLIALVSGAAVHILGMLKAANLTFESCNFNSIASN